MGPSLGIHVGDGLRLGLCDGRELGSCYLRETVLNERRKKINALVLQPYAVHTFEHSKIKSRVDRWKT